MDFLAFLLKTPHESIIKTQIGDVTNINIFYSEKNEKIGYTSGKERETTINKFLTAEKLHWEDITIEMNILIKISGRLPVYQGDDYEKDGWTNVNTNVMEAIGIEIEKGVMDVSISSYFLELKKKYIVISKGPLLAVVFNDVDDYNYDYTMLWMKDILMGNYITEPFETLVAKKQKNGLSKETIHNHDVHTNYIGDNVAKYMYKGKQYTTPLFGVYTPTFWKQSFQDFERLPSGRILQMAQYKILFEAGESNYIIAPGGFGKSALLLGLAKNYILGDKVTPWERTDGKMCFYYGISHASNTASIAKIVKMTNKILESEDIVIKSDILQLKTANGGGKNLVCYKSPAQTKSGDAHGMIQFLSGESAEPGRGGRPTEVIVDEYLKVNPYVQELVGRWNGNPLVRKRYISTANPDSKANPMYMNQLNAERMYAGYKETMHDLVFEERHRIGLDKCTTMEQFAALQPEIIKARERIMMKRPVVGLRFDIRNVEYDSQDKKDYRVKTMLSESGVERVMCELFSVIPSDKSHFSTEGLIVDIVPQKFDFITYGIDLAKRMDKPALTKIGILNDSMYVYESIETPNDLIEQQQLILTEQEKDMARLKDRKKGGVFLCVDASGNNPDYVRESWENRNVYADYWVYTTTRTKKDMGFDDNGFFVVGKSQMVDIAQEYFKTRRVYIHNSCTDKGGLVEQLSHFKYDGRTWKADKGFDDLVLAMLMAMTVAHDQGVKLRTAEVDRKEVKYRGISEVDRLTLEDNEKQYNKQREIDDDLYNSVIYGMF